MDLARDAAIGAPTWAHLDTLRLGKWGEYFTKMAFVRAGLDVYSPEVDDRAIDFLVRIPDNSGDPGTSPRYLEIQVKSVRAAKPGYTFMRKRHFPIRADTLLALVHLAEGVEAVLYLIPSLVWRNPVWPFTSPDYEGKKSEPEHGIWIKPETFPKLEPYLFPNVLPQLIAGTWPREM
ncbi:DUF4365 domain-containing protein [Methylobacterium planeticum]|uniref:DUF4365 domain-containing protein n=1 Tax=Methylobacterium planeticum TaxID=2615211 RepID=A0A6N6MH80_9HYPH|nr:DUF4365 domain-containing protein [Methylobacterium planeticum]KAB1068829.1 DUF4365 domain-containing protein [Methylobacterium planeticum]